MMRVQIKHVKIIFFDLNNELPRMKTFKVDNIDLNNCFWDSHDLTLAI